MLRSRRRELPDSYFATVMAGGFQVPSMIEGGVSFGQYRRIMGTNLRLWRGQPVGFLRLARRVGLEIQVHRTISDWLRTCCAGSRCND